MLSGKKISSERTQKLLSEKEPWTKNSSQDMGTKWIECPQLSWTQANSGSSQESWTQRSLNLFPRPSKSCRGFFNILDSVYYQLKGKIGWRNKTIIIYHNEETNSGEGRELFSYKKTLVKMLKYLKCFTQEVRGAPCLKGTKNSLMECRITAGAISGKTFRSKISCRNCQGNMHSPIMIVVPLKLGKYFQDFW